MRAPRIFLSYDFKAHTQLADSLSTSLHERGFEIWQDRRRRRTLIRLLAAWRNPAGDLGLDHWLRKGILQSDIIVGLIAYAGEVAPDGWKAVRPKTAENLLRLVAEEAADLRNSYSGRATSKWDDPRHLDQGTHYFLQPIHTARMAWYENHGLPPLGKDPFEHWRRWEMRVAGAASIPVIFVVQVDRREEHFAVDVDERLAEDPTIVVVRQTNLGSDVNDRLLPAIDRALPSPEEAKAIGQRRRRIRLLHLRTNATTWLVAGIVVLEVVGIGVRISALFR